MVGFEVSPEAYAEGSCRILRPGDTHPEKWYPRDRSGALRKFDDLPDKYHRNVDNGMPFGGREGGNPALNDAAVNDVIAFLNTLTDGYRQEP